MHRLIIGALATTASSLALLAACGSGQGNGSGQNGGGSSSGALVFGDGSYNPDAGGGGGSTVATLPSNFVHTEFGGYALGPALSGSGTNSGVVNTAPGSCSLV